MKRIAVVLTIILVAAVVLLIMGRRHVSEVKGGTAEAGEDISSMESTPENATKPTKTFTYTRDTEGTELTTVIEITPTATGRLIRKKNDNEEVLMECDQSGATLRWEATSRKPNIQLRVIRRENALAVQGHVKGKKLKTGIEIDERPWFQDVGLNISEFALSGAESISFWSLHPEKIEAHEMKVTRSSTEEIPIGGKQVQAVKTKMVVDRFGLRRLWAGYHWHRASDGLFLGYSADGKLPGAKNVKVDIVSGY